MYNIAHNDPAMKRAERKVPTSDVGIARSQPAGQACYPTLGTGERKSCLGCRICQDPKSRFWYLKGIAAKTKTMMNLFMYIGDPV